MFCLSACLKSGTARTPEDACTDLKSPSLFPGLDWGTGLHPCLGMWNYVPTDAVLPFIGNCVRASDNCTKMAEFGVEKKTGFAIKSCRVFSSGESILFLLCAERFPSLWVEVYSSFHCHPGLSGCSSQCWSQWKHSWQPAVLFCCPRARCWGTASKVALLIPRWGFPELFPGGRCPWACFRCVFMCRQPQ